MISNDLLYLFLAIGITLGYLISMVVRLKAMVDGNKPTNSKVGNELLYITHPTSKDQWRTINCNFTHIQDATKPLDSKYEDLTKDSKREIIMAESLTLVMLNSKGDKTEEVLNHGAYIVYYKGEWNERIFNTRPMDLHVSTKDKSVVSLRYISIEVGGVILYTNGYKPDGVIPDVLVTRDGIDVYFCNENMYHEIRIARMEESEANILSTVKKDSYPNGREYKINYIA